MERLVNPLIPMGAITSPMSADEIEAMLDRYASVGIQQFLFYARGGCTVPFMSGEWLDICENIVRGCEKRGISVWLYDEYDCPSGTCARTIINDFPEYKSRGIRIKDGKCEITSDCSYIPMSDLMNPGCVDEFTGRTYERLYTRLKPWFGTVIKGVFSDEPSLGCRLGTTVDTFAYTPGIENEYPGELFSDLTGGRSFSEYYELLYRRFRHTYIDRLREWCEARGVLFTGHLLEENNLRNACASSGNLLKCLRGFSLPGIDEIFGKTGRDAEWVTLATGLSARNENGLLAELGAFGPCDQPLARYLRLIRLAALFGVDHYVLAVSAADAKGSLVKTDWLHPTNYIQPHFECFGELSEMARQAAALAQKQIDYDTVVEYPAEEAASEIFHAENTVDERLNALAWNLTRNQNQWKFVTKDEATPEGARRIRYFESAEPRPFVTDEAGNLPENILARRYKDGTFAVLDLSDSGEKRRLYADGKPFTLYPMGLYTGEAAEYEAISDINAEFRLSYDRPRAQRCVFQPDRLTYSIEGGRKIRLYIRSFAFDGVVMLDGQTVQASAPCEGLSPGLHELYLQTDEITLSPGGHSISISAHPGKSEYYLPSVFIAANDLPDTLRTGDRLSGYSGVLTFETEVQIPAGGEYIEIDGNELCLSVYADDVSLGTRVCAPYIFSLPEGKRDVRLKIRQFTTIGPIFRSRDEVLEGVPEGRILCRYFPGKYDVCGIERISVLRKEDKH